MAARNQSKEQPAPNDRRGDVAHGGSLANRGDWLLAHQRTLARAVTAPASIPEFRMETSWPRTPSVRLVHRAVLNTEN